MDDLQQILVVDDKIDIQELLCDFLRNTGYVADACANGKQALDFVRNKRYNLVICDLNMPHMDGFEFSSLMKQFAPVPIIFMTGGSRAKRFEERLKELEKEGHLVLKKPFSPDTLLSNVKQKIRK